MKRRLYLLVSISLIFILSTSCSEKREKKGIEYISFTDDGGRQLKIRKDASRFISLTPSISEILGMICPDSQIVGRTPYCNYPSSILDQPVINNYPPDFERIIALRPDIVFVKYGFLTHEQALTFEEAGIVVVFQRYESFKDIFRHLHSMGELTGHVKRANTISDSLQQLQQSLQATIPILKKSALLLISKDNLYAYGGSTFTKEVLELSGCINIVDSTLKTEFPELTIEYILSHQPEVIIGAGFLFEQPDLFEIHPELKRLNAYKTKNYYVVNEDLLSRPGPRIFQCVIEIRKLIAHEK
jgi:iron complex transport system substrate-binding protein